jgi:hypothetical protein
VNNSIGSDWVMSFEVYPLRGLPGTPPLLPRFIA